jgi:hypothetical protein
MDVTASTVIEGLAVRGNRLVIALGKIGAVWDIVKRTRLGLHRGHTHLIPFVEFDDRLVVTGAGHKMVRVYIISNGCLCTAAVDWIHAD